MSNSDADRFAAMDTAHDLCDDGYNGWANHATWVVALWLNNSYGAYQSLCEIMDNKKWSNTDKAFELRSFVGDIIEIEKDLQLDNRGERWGVGIRQDFHDHENLKDVHWIDIVEAHES